MNDLMNFQRHFKVDSIKLFISNLDYAGKFIGMIIATKKCFAIYCDKQGRTAICITIYWDSVKSTILTLNGHFNATVEA